ncbi:MAG: TOBE domain-containing protein [Eubacteriaceae bacterium]|nr:TOBE domain-containing protein [Eubacteriaceae bacterium]
MKLSARNQIKGTIVEIKEGVVTAKVVVDIGGGNKITSSITMDSVKDLDLKVGKEVYAIVKASSVMLGVDHSS